MSRDSGAAGLAALSVCESILLSLAENDVIDAAEIRGILEDAAAAHRDVPPWADSAGDDHARAAALIELIIERGDSVRRRRPATPDASGSEPEPGAS